MRMLGVLKKNSIRVLPISTLLNHLKHLTLFKNVQYPQWPQL